jgi:hypothetical protein
LHRDRDEPAGGLRARGECADRDELVRANVTGDDVADRRRGRGADVETCLAVQPYPAHIQVRGGQMLPGNQVVRRDVDPREAIGGREDAGADDDGDEDEKYAEQQPRVHPARHRHAGGTWGAEVRGARGVEMRGTRGGNVGHRAHGDARDTSSERIVHRPASDCGRSQRAVRRDATLVRP